MTGPPVGLRPARRRLLRLAGGLESKDAVEHPLLRGRQLLPADPLRRRPGSEVLALHTSPARTGSAPQDRTWARVRWKPRCESIPQRVDGGGRDERVDPHTPRPSATEALATGATVLLYTDGLIERPGEDLTPDWPGCASTPPPSPARAFPSSWTSFLRG
ncbi:hypothetical protein [Streptomyces sp. NBC_01764]|uniref:hypothetical protein n=1 Tax=Streptomyces sp. NBC_01764 TaxID=2975935 RepID=UPI002B1CDEE1|nr:hypothetical protein [Streptomyces sp. NBC_01764]